MRVCLYPLKKLTLTGSINKVKKKTDKDRSDVKIDNLKESTLIIFFLVGINFQNIASNEPMVTSMLNKLIKMDGN